MSDEFMSALVDTLIPGGALANRITAPKASDIAADWGALEPLHAGVLAAIAPEADTRAAFCSGTDDQRGALLRSVEKSHPGEFAALVTAVLTLYYESPEALAAFGWPSRPPQPLGHTLEPFDEELLAPVKARGEIWRKP